MQYKRYDDDHKPYTQISPMDIYTSLEAWKSFQPALSQQSFKFKIVLKRYIIQIDIDSTDTIPSRGFAESDAKTHLLRTCIDVKKSIWWNH